MIKFTLKSILSILLLISSHVYAGLITTELTDEHYITYKDIDWAWASSVNVEYYYDNILYAPDAFDRDWRIATEDELNILRNELTLADFTAVNESGETYIIQALQYWNTVLTDVDEQNFIDDLVNSAWPIIIKNEYYYETFYVRNSAASLDDKTSAKVPETSTIMILAIGLIGLSMRKRMKK